MTAHYFPHDYHARHDPKLLALRRQHGLAGLGAYWCLVEFIYEQDGELTADELHDLAYDLRCEEQLLAALIYDFGLFQYDQDRKVVTCAAVTERLQVRAEKREKAQKSANNRWNGANAMPTHSDRIPSRTDSAESTQSDRNAIKGKERKEKESKEDSKLTNKRGDEVAVPTEKKTTPKKVSHPAPHPELAEAWSAYLELRQRNRWATTDYSVKLLIGKLEKLRPGDPAGQRELLEVAIERGWRGIFEPRDQTTTPNTTRKNETKPTLADRYNDHAAHLADKWGLR